VLVFSVYFYRVLLPSIKVGTTRFAVNPKVRLLVLISLLICASLLCARGTTNAAILEIHCQVFHDLNADGSQQAEEPPLSGIRITNGVELFLTNEDGTTGFELDTANYRFVTLTTPAGMWPTTPRYRRYGEESSSPDTLCFGLRDCPESADDPVRWIHIADTQIYGWNYDLVADLDALAEIPERPVFIINAGDIVNDGSDREHWDIYASMIAQSEIPVLHVPGNHDYCDGDEPLALYEEYVGPPYYSIEFGDLHLIAYNDRFIDVATPLQDQWLANDVALRAPGSRPIIVVHHMLRETPLDRIEFWVDLGIEIIFSGHWHSINFSDSDYGIDEYNISQTRHGPLDRTPRVLSVVTSASDGTTTYDLRRALINHRSFLSHPAGGREIRGNQVEVLAQALDTSFDLVDLRATLQGQNTTLGPFSLTREGITLWRSQIDISDALPGSYTINVDGSFEDGMGVALFDSFTIVAGDPPQPEAGEDWPMFRHNSSGTSHTLDCPAPPLALAWCTQVPGMVALSSPVISDQTVYFGYRSEQRIEDAGIAALSLQTGEVLWDRWIRGGVALAPAVVGDIVIVNGLCDYSYGLNRHTGELLWTHSQPRAKYDMTAPVVRDGLAYVGGEPYTYCVDVITGAEIWQTVFLGQNWFPYIYSSPVLCGDILYHGLYGLYGDSGNNGGLCSIDAGSGSLIREVEQGAFRAPICAGDVMYVIGSEHHQEQVLQARDSATGSVIWTAATEIGRGTAAPALAHDILVVAGFAGAVQAFDTEDGNLLWSHAVEPTLYHFIETIYGAATNTAAAIADSVVYIGSLDGNLYALDLFTGAELFRFPVGTPIASSAAISGNMVVVGACDGHLYGFVSAADQQVTSAPQEPIGGTTITRMSVWPSPSCGSCTVSWSQQRKSDVVVRVIDLRGRVVRVLMQESRGPGPHTVSWNGQDAAAGRTPAGVYFLQVKAGQQIITKKVTLLR